MGTGLQNRSLQPPTHRFPCGRDMYLFERRCRGSKEGCHRRSGKGEEKREEKKKNKKRREERTTRGEGVETRNRRQKKQKPQKQTEDIEVSNQPKEVTKSILQRLLPQRWFMLIIS